MQVWCERSLSRKADTSSDVLRSQISRSLPAQLTWALCWPKYYRLRSSIAAIQGLAGSVALRALQHFCALEQSIDANGQRARSAIACPTSCTECVLFGAVYPHAQFCERMPIRTGLTSLGLCPLLAAGRRASSPAFACRVVAMVNRIQALY